MRDIKFRAWDRQFKIMSDSFVSKLVIAQDEVYSLEQLINNDNWRVMQYTGLKDKNGKEIYEGDIYKRKKGFSTGSGISEIDNIRVVRFNHGTYGLIGLMDIGMNPVPLASKHNLENGEVIGNIYENREMLTHSS